ncbi:MAG: hypothetical protein R3A44_10480 [Caldilineaceae bacterium]
MNRYQRPAMIVGGVGLVLALVGAALDRTQFWQSYLFAYIFWLSVGLGCLGLLMLHHLVGGRWSALIRRVMEAGAMTLPWMALLFIPLLLALTTLYPWTNAEHVQASELLQAKTAWLNVPFFIGRAALYLLIWAGLAWQLNKLSRAQDETDDPALGPRMRRLSAIGIILYMLTATFAGYDWMMSLEPEWFSSIYGLLFIAGQGIAAIALAIIGLNLLAGANGDDADWVKPRNDLGNMLLGFVMIWAYFSFSQFLVIWSADIPEEAIWYYHRTQGGWREVAIVLIALHFVLPFLLLLARGLKRNARWLTALAAFIFLARLLDLFWQIMPAFYPAGLHIHWLDLALVCAMGGGWITLFLLQWAGRPAVALHDPQLDAHGHMHGVEQGNGTQMSQIST